MNPRSHRVSAAAITTVALAAAAAGSILARPAAGGLPAPQLPPQVRWTRISGPAGAGQQLGLARTPGGVSVFWNSDNGAGTPATIFQTRISIDGAVLGTTTVASGWDGLDGLAAQGSPYSDRVSLLAAGGYEPGLPPAQVGIYTLQNFQDGAVPVTPPGLASGWWLRGTGNAFDNVPEVEGGAAPFLSWNGGYIAWAAAGVADVFYAQGNPQVPAAISADADVVSQGLSQGSLAGVVGETIGDPAGTYVQQYPPRWVLGPLPKPTVLPSATQTMGDYGTTDTGNGLYVAWSDANRPGVRASAVRLTRFGGPRSAPTTRLIAHGRFTVAKVFGDGGVLWLVWGNEHALFVTRSNKAVTRFEPVQKLTPPAGTSFLWNAEGDSYGPLDLFVDAATGTGRGFWYTRVLPQPTLEVGLSNDGTRPRVVTLELRDADDPAGYEGLPVTVTLPNRHTVTVKMNAHGRATFATRLAGRYTATATASPQDYLPATTTFTLP